MQGNVMKCKACGVVTEQNPLSGLMRDQTTSCLECGGLLVLSGPRRLLEGATGDIIPDANPEGSK